MLEGNQNLAEHIARERNWAMLSDEVSLTQMCETLVKDNPDKVCSANCSLLGNSVNVA
jgi:Asp-tRNA(Asn)/Glu-tRNA(Gln) amidotransferase B subunit